MSVTFRNLHWFQASPSMKTQKDDLSMANNALISKADVSSELNIHCHKA